MFRAFEIELRKRGKTPPQPQQPPPLNLRNDAPVNIEEPDRETAPEPDIPKIEAPTLTTTGEVESSQKPRQDAVNYETPETDRAPESRRKQTRIELVDSYPRPDKVQPMWIAKVVGFLPSKKRAGVIIATMAVIALLGYGAWSAMSSRSRDDSSSSGG